MNTDKEILKSWRVGAELPPSFNAQVWRRIEERQRASLPELFREWLQEVFARRSFVLAYAASAVVVGLVLGQVQGSRAVRTEAAELQAKYVQTVDPYSAPAPR